MKIFAPITKRDDDQRLVYGYASTESRDNQGEIIKAEAIKEALTDYMTFANIREMHQPKAAGICESAELNEKGLYICAKIVDDDAWEKVKTGVYKGFSVGGQSISKADKVITKMRMTEISLVDRPCNPECVIDIWKTDETTPTNEGVETVSVLQKGMYTVANLASLLESLNDIRQSAEWENTHEGDSSTVPAELKSAIDGLAAILVKMTAEEAMELTMKAEQPGDIAKTDLDNSLAKLTGALTSIQKAFTEGLHDLSARIAKLESQPEPPKAAAKVIPISKVDDNRIGTIDAAVSDDPLTAIKKIHQSGPIGISRSL